METNQSMIKENTVHILVLVFCALLLIPVIIAHAKGWGLTATFMLILDLVAAILGVIGLAKENKACEKTEE